MSDVLGGLRRFFEVDSTEEKGVSVPPAYERATNLEDVAVEENDHEGPAVQVEKAEDETGSSTASGDAAATDEAEVASAGKRATPTGDGIAEPAEPAAEEAVETIEGEVELDGHFDEYVEMPKADAGEIGPPTVFFSPTKAAAPVRVVDPFPAPVAHGDQTPRTVARGFAAVSAAAFGRRIVERAAKSLSAAGKAEVNVVVDKTKGAHKPSEAKRKQLVLEVARESKGQPMGLSLSSSRTIAGVVITAVEPGSPAAEAGLRAGDSVVCVGSEWVSTVEDVQSRLKVIAGTAAFVVTRIVGNNGLPKGWKSLADDGGKVRYYRTVKDGGSTKREYTTQHPNALEPLRALGSANTKLEPTVVQV